MSDNTDPEMARRLAEQSPTPAPPLSAERERQAEIEALADFMRDAPWPCTTAAKILAAGYIPPARLARLGEEIERLERQRIEFLACGETREAVHIASEQRGLRRARDLIAGEGA